MNRIHKEERETMKNTIIVMSSNRSIQPETRAAIGGLVKLGAAFALQSGCADVALSRCIALSSACSIALNDPTRDTVLMVDDDMQFSTDDAKVLIEHSRATGISASACYATVFGTVAATPIIPRTFLNGRRLWLSGLGLLAIPVTELLHLQSKSQEFEAPDEASGGTVTRTEFTSSSARNGRWYSEDYELCTRLGGVHLLPVIVGHLKTIPIYPDTDTIQRILRDDETP